MRTVPIRDISICSSSGIGKPNSSGTSNSSTSKLNKIIRYRVGLVHQIGVLYNVIRSLFGLHKHFSNVNSNQPQDGKIKSSKERNNKDQGSPLWKVVIVNHR